MLIENRMKTEDEIKDDGIYLHKALGVRLLSEWLKSGLATAGLRI
jgi:hypothetical protein